MNNFTKAWITSTCAPESIVNLRSKGGNELDVVYNENKSLKVYILSNHREVLSIGRHYEDLCHYNKMTFSQACSKCAQLLGLSVYSIS